MLAADDFLLFKSNMVRRNIDMELQALTLLRKQTGHSPEAYDKDSHPRGDTGSSEKRLKEEELLKEAVKLSEAQYQLEHLLDEEELERMIEQAKRESLELYQQQQQQSTVSEREQEQQLTASEREGERGGRGGGRGEVSVTGEEIPTGRLPEHTDSREVVESTGTVESMAAEPKVIQSSESPVSSSTGGFEGTLQQREEREVEGVTHDTLPPLPVEQPQSSLEHSEPERPREEPVDGGDDAMAKWLEMAKTGASSESTTPVQPHSHRHCQHTHAVRTITHTNLRILHEQYMPQMVHYSQYPQGPTPEQLRARELYLKRQRDQLLETKRKQRVHSTPVNAPTTSSSQQRQGVQTPATAAVSRDGGSSGGRGGGGRRGKDTGILSSAIAGNLKKS